MISQALAAQLKDAGLVWHTSVHDFFAIPDRDLDGRIFVLSDMMVTMQLLRGWPAVVFHGTSEWALDYLFTHEAIWLPTESQLREKLEEELAARNGRFHQLQRQEAGYVCEVALDGERLAFTAVDPSEAYGLALLDLLQRPMLK
ncbi:pilus assembly protein CpaE [Candidatus Leptofilum sp.]|uniref:pilus assembly protein CpaE n=1 Tax=Candidatus Leptofilum sp. TaxID=3241576 RepID=UPI003B59453C